MHVISDPGIPVVTMLRGRKRAGAMVSVLRYSRVVMNAGWLIHLLAVCFDDIF